MKVRQFVVVARDLDSVVDDFCAVLGIEVGFNDPGVKEFGLRNAVMPVGHTFLEVVSPIDPKATAARYLAQNGGDGGYMLVVQSDNLDRDRKRLETLGVRTVWKLDLPDVRGTHLHPKDTGGTLLSLDDATPADSWHWAGPKWREHVRRETVGAITAAELQSEDPCALAKRWSQVLCRPLRELSSERFTIPLDNSEIRFVQKKNGGGERLSAFEIEVIDRAALLARARDRGCPIEDGRVRIAGVSIGMTASARRQE
jgi:Glyoxalase-like domain